MLITGKDRVYKDFYRGLQGSVKLRGGQGFFRRYQVLPCGGGGSGSEAEAAGPAFSSALLLLLSEVGVQLNIFYH